MDKREEIAKYTEKVNRLINHIKNTRVEIKHALKKLAELQDCKVFIIPSLYNGVVFEDYIIAKDKDDAINIGISQSAYDEIIDVGGDGDIQEENIYELDIID